MFTKESNLGSTTMFRDYSDMVNVSELSQMLKIGRNTAYELVRAGIIPSVKIGRQIRIAKESVLDFIRKEESV